jgi:large subunit ribosomal protein L25
MARPVINARFRQGKGKEAARKIRKNKQLPAVFYGPNTETMRLSVDYRELMRVVKQFAGENIIVDLKVQSDKGTDSRSAMLKDLQTDPIKDTYLHADFYEISMDREITVSIPIQLINTPVGVTNGGVLQHVTREITVSCLPGKLVDSLELDVSGLDIGDALHVRDLELPEGITSHEEDDLSVALVAAPTVEPVEAEEEEIEEEAAEEEAAKTEAEGPEES